MSILLSSSYSQQSIFLESKTSRNYEKGSGTNLNRTNSKNRLSKAKEYSLKEFDPIFKDNMSRNKLTQKNINHTLS